MQGLSVFRDTEPAAVVFASNQNPYFIVISTTTSVIGVIGLRSDYYLSLSPRVLPNLQQPIG